MERVTAPVEPTDPADSERAAAGGCIVRGADPERVELGREVLLDDETYARLAEIFRTLADSSRA